jgi:hypothetical protein
VFDAIGHGTDLLGNDVTYPEYDGEYADVPVTTTGENGCTPGFWRIQPKFEPTQCWCAEVTLPDGTVVELEPGPVDPTLVGEVFDIPASLINTGKKGPGLGDTLNDALLYGGGGGVEGAARNLLRSAVAAVLNACNDNVAYPMGEQAVILAVNDALATLDRDTILALHTTLDGYNNLGCSIDNHCNPIPVPTLTPPM